MRRPVSLKVGLLKLTILFSVGQLSSYFTTKEWTREKKSLLGSLEHIDGGTGALLFAFDQLVKASDLEFYSL
ncbi:unnamed protein product [Diabrotica balteata]|uniref:Uncharacterized protein n=1 Tax=Diabrotica balteata TaxID=107213 RepID=A0A9N9T407_DIABA|nr:unnamed protein product [Diabrotica balteata]